MDEYLRLAIDLRTRMWRTAGARFIAADRLTKRDRFSTFSIALLSVVAIGVGLLDPHLSTFAQRVSGGSTAAVTAILSVFILVLSLVEGSGQTSVRATKLHENAVHISEVRTDLETMLARSQLANSPDWEQLAELRKAYETRIRECPFNHDPVDYQRFQVNHRTSPEFADAEGQPRMSWPEAQWVKLHHIADTSWLSFASWIFVVAFVVLTFAWGNY